MVMKGGFGMGNGGFKKARIIEEGRSHYGQRMSQGRKKRSKERGKSALTLAAARHGMSVPEYVCMRGEL